MPIASGFSQDPNPNYSVRKPGKTDVLDEAIYYKRDMPYEKPVEVVTRPVIKETIFLPDRKPPPLASSRDRFTVSSLLTSRHLYTKEYDLGVTCTGSNCLSCLSCHNNNNINRCFSKR